MEQILVYGDSLSWGVVPNTRKRLPFAQRWPGVLENQLIAKRPVRVIEDCLNGRRTVWEDPFKPGRNGIVGIGQRIEVSSPLALVILMLGTNDYQGSHQNTSWQSAQGLAAIVRAIRSAPLEPEMPAPKIMIVAPPPIRVPNDPVSPKFAGAELRCAGMAEAYEQIAKEESCGYFDAGTVIQASTIDGVHLEAPQHDRLGRALAGPVLKLLSGSS